MQINSVSCPTVGDYFPVYATTNAIDSYKNITNNSISNIIQAKYSIPHNGAIIEFTLEEIKASLRQMYPERFI